MKKIISLIIVLAIALSVCTFASAEEKKKDMEISYSTSEGYVLTIPANTSFSTAGSVSGSVKLENVLLTSGKEIAVKMSSANNFNLKCEGSSIAYSVTEGEKTLANNVAVLIVQAGATSGSSTLSFTTTKANIDKATLAGEHKDTLSFEVGYAAIGTYESGTAKGM